jgi:hypothetical protein
LPLKFNLHRYAEVVEGKHGHYTLNDYEVGGCSS